MAISHFDFQKFNRSKKQTPTISKDPGTSQSILNKSEEVILWVVCTPTENNNY